MRAAAKLQSSGEQNRTTQLPAGTSPRSAILTLEHRSFPIPPRPCNNPRTAMRFFATNRSLDRLGQAVADKHSPRELRHKLSKGGYYFVDMDRYMRYFLGTVDRRRIPHQAIVDNSQNEVFAEFLHHDAIKSIVLCVHGYNVELHESFTWFRVLIDTMRNIPGLGDQIVTSPAEINDESSNATAFIGFSWPSDGKVLNYLSDQSEARGSVTAFASLLARVRQKKKVHILGHSMGNYLICHTLASLVNEQFEPPGIAPELRKLVTRRHRKDTGEDVSRDQWLVDNYVMVAPDVERRHVTKCKDDRLRTDYVGPFYSGLQHLVGRKINVYSRFDMALKVSDLEKAGRSALMTIGEKLTRGLLAFRERNPDLAWEKRLGSAPAPINAAPDFSSVNATELANRPIGHSDHIDSPDIAKRIAEELQIFPSANDTMSLDTG